MPAARIPKAAISLGKYNRPAPPVVNRNGASHLQLVKGCMEDDREIIIVFVSLAN